MLKSANKSVLFAVNFAPLLRLLAIVGFLLTAVIGTACNDCKEDNPAKCETTCDRKGECDITYRHNADGAIVQMDRKCRLLSDKDEQRCAACRDQVRSEDGKNLSQTCIVCNLCNNDFQCIDNEDCQGTTPYCQRGVCVHCRDDSDCLNKDATRPRCTSDGCVRCLKDTECQSKELPQCYDGLCVTCRCPTLQPNKPLCWQKADFFVECVECLEDADCKLPKPTCSRETHTCTPQCQKNSDCATDQFCHEGLCSVCKEHADCKDPQRPRCVQGACLCINDSDCGSAYPICSKQMCVECVRDGDCPVGFPRCASGQCQLKLCNSNADCTSSSDYALCRRVGRVDVCVGCTSDQDCSGGWRCDLVSFTCRNLP